MAHEHHHLAADLDLTLGPSSLSDYSDGPIRGD